jgi:hypothetical protein
MDDHDPFNRAIWITTLVLGVTLAVAGFHHGLFEVLQGNRPTGGMAIHSIGLEQVRWNTGPMMPSRSSRTSCSRG